MNIKNAWLHLRKIQTHRKWVRHYCFGLGLYKQGLLHDLSKYSPTEFFESVKYYQGNRSPIGVCRRTTGMSYAWLHHKGRNKHHIEYWYDPDCEVLPLMPYKYAVECVCDKLSATKTYAKGAYTPAMPLEHWNRYGSKAPGNPLTMRFIEQVFLDISRLPEKQVLNKAYMKNTYKRICIDGEEII